MLRATVIWRQLSRILLSSDGRLLTSASTNLERLERRKLLTMELPRLGRLSGIFNGQAKDHVGRVVALGSLADATAVRVAAESNPMSLRSSQKFTKGNS